MSEMKEQRFGIVEAYEKAEEVSCQAMIQMRKDNVKITADMTLEEIMDIMGPYYKRQYQTTDQDQA